jgi:CO/xanthine dehydrogenase Mo-binding subunit
MDQIAEVLGMDPLVLRARNLVEEGDQYSTGQVLHEEPHYHELMADAAARIGVVAFPAGHDVPVKMRNGLTSSGAVV